jgi:hypothetical protein
LVVKTRPVHNHGTEQGLGLACPESLIGDCIREQTSAMLIEDGFTILSLRTKLDAIIEVFEPRHLDGRLLTRNVGAEEMARLKDIRKILGI